MTKHSSSILIPLRRLFDEVWNQQQLDVLEDIVDPRCVINPGANEVRGVAGFKEMVRGFLEAFPDVQHHMLDVVGEGTEAAVRWEGEGTHRGEFNGLPATGKQMRYWGITLFRVVNGRIIEAWVVADMAGLMKCLTE